MSALTTFVTSSPYVVWGPLVALVVLFFALMAVFGAQVATQGMPHNPRVANLGNAGMSQFFLEYFYWLQKPVGPLAVKLRIHPDVLSWSSLVLQLAAAWAIATNAIALGGWLLFFGAACDSLDGTVARARNMASDAGEVLDAIIDRWGEMATCFGFAFYYRSWTPGFVLSVWACAASVMVSYTRAKGDTLGLKASQGFMNRHERAAYTITALVFSAFLGIWKPEWDTPHHWLVVLALALISLFGTLTAIRRTRFMRVELRKR